MSTAYSTVVCFQCGATVPQGKVHQCPAVLALTESRVVELIQKYVMDHENTFHLPLKSQPAAFDPEMHAFPMRQEVPGNVATKLERPAAAQARAQEKCCCGGLIADGYSDPYDFHSKYQCGYIPGPVKAEIATLKHRLEEAEASIKAAYDAVPFGWKDDEGHRLVKNMLLILSEALKRTGRLGPKDPQ